jgi:hypothetical protein
MALSCKIGASLTFDAVAYVRNKIEDLTAPFVISDAALSLYVEAAVEEYSKWNPIGDLVVGSFAATPPTSTFQTTAYVSRYSCTAANGFTSTPTTIQDVLYRASGVFSAASEIAYLALMPVSPLNWFRIDKDLLNSPTSRHIRDQYLQELDHYGIGYWRTARDSSGNLALDLFPAPVTAGLPVFVRYTAAHANTPDGLGNPQYATIPEIHKIQFARFLLAQVIEEEADRLTKTSQLKAGITQRWSSPQEARLFANELRDKAEASLGGNVSEIMVSW